MKREDLNDFSRQLISKIEIYGQNVKESMSGFDNYGDPDSKLAELKTFIDLMMREISLNLTPEFELIKSYHKFFALLACGDLIPCDKHNATHYTVFDGTEYWARVL